MIINFIKKFCYCFIANKFRVCNLCSGLGNIELKGFPANKRVENHWSTSEGTIKIPCTSCNGNGIIFGVDY